MEQPTSHQNFIRHAQNASKQRLQAVKTGESHPVYLSAGDSIQTAGSVIQQKTGLTVGFTIGFTHSRLSKQIA